MPFFQWLLNSQWYLWTMRIWNTLTWIVIFIWMIEFNSQFPDDIYCGYHDSRVSMSDQNNSNCPTNIPSYDTKPSERCSCWQDPYQYDDKCKIAMDVSKCNAADGSWTCSCYYTASEPQSHYVWLYCYIGFVIFIECGKLYTIISTGWKFASI
eukprot:313818_1